LFYFKWYCGSSCLAFNQWYWSPFLYQCCTTTSLCDGLTVLPKLHLFSSSPRWGLSITIMMPSLILLFISPCIMCTNLAINLIVFVDQPTSYSFIASDEVYQSRFRLPQSYYNLTLILLVFILPINRYGFFFWYRTSSCIIVYCCCGVRVVVSIPVFFFPW